MKIAVVGAGLFGLDCALRLCKSHDVHVFEKEDDILMGATNVNQRRIHEGFHYPRSSKTVLELQNSLEEFYKTYRSCIDRAHEHYYLIAKENSFVTPDQYLEFCDNHELKYDLSHLSIVNEDKIGLTIKVNEGLLNITKLRNFFYEKIKDTNIKLNLGSEFLSREIENFDLVINCTYSNINNLLSISDRKNYQFELCEKMIVRLPDHFKNKSIVVMDGPFFCLDPYEDTGCHLVGHVRHAIHLTNVGHDINRKEYSEYLKYFKEQISSFPLLTRKNLIFEDIKQYFKFNEPIVYIGSMFITRAVLPNVENTDERPTIVSRTGKIISVFSGKLATCVQASKQVEEEINSLSLR